MKATFVLTLMLTLCAGACSAAPESSATDVASTAAPKAEVDGKGTAVIKAYREKVIANAERINPRAADTARMAYVAVDGGESSQAATDLGGIAQAKKWVRRFVGLYEEGLLRECMAKHFGSDTFSAAYADALAASPVLESLVSDAQRFAPREYDESLDAAKASFTAPDSARAAAAVAALMTHQETDAGPTKEDLKLLGTAYMAKATNGACNESPEVTAMLAPVR